MIDTPDSCRNNPANTREAAIDGKLDTDFDAAGSSDMVGSHKITSTPKPGALTKVNVKSGKTFRYSRYLSPDGGSCETAEIPFLHWHPKPYS